MAQLMTGPSPAVPENAAPSDLLPTGLFTAEDYMNRPMPSYLDDEGLIPTHGITMLVGQPGTAKSLWTLRKLAQIANDHPVLFIVGEGHGGIPMRLLATHVKYFFPPNRLFVYDGALDLTNAKSVDTLLQLLHNRGITPKLIAFDTLAACSGGADENSATQMSGVLTACRRIQQDFRASILLVHHTTKDGQNYRGSSVLHASADAMYFMEAAEQKETFTLTCKKVKDDEMFSPIWYTLSRTGRVDGRVGATVVAIDPPVSAKRARKGGLNETQLAILRLLANGEPQRNGEVARALGMTPTGMNDAWKALLQLGYTEKTTREDVKDRRARFAQITESGLQMLASEE